MLAWTIYLSFIGAVAVTLTPGERPVLTRVTALVTLSPAWPLRWWPWRMIVRDK